ncbi:MAG: WD40 repeat domain-containing protein, partial [bacterium]|nr:WD40 repeat domain-containing protein [bacterium]
MMSFVDGARLLYVLPSKGVGMVVDTESGDIIASPPRRDVQWVAQKTARLFGYDRDSGMFTVVDLTTGAVIVTIDAPGDARLRRFSLTPKNEIAVILYSDGSLAMLAPSDAQERRLSADGGGRVLEFYGSLEGSNSILVSTGTDSVAILNAATSVIQPVDGVTSEQKPVLAAALPRGRVAYIEEQGSSYIRFQGGSTLEPTENSIEGQVESLVGTVVSEGVLVKDDTGEVYWVPEDRDRVEVLISGNADPLTSIAVSARSGLLVVGHQSGMIRVHRAPGMQETLELRGHTARVSVLSLSEGGAELVSASADGTVRHWLITTPAVQVVIGPHAWNNGDYEEMDFVTRRRMALAPDSRSIALRDDDHHVSIWSIAGEGTSPVRREDTGGTLDFGFTPDSGRVFIVNDKGELNIHQIDGTAIGQWGDVAPIIDLTTLDLFQSSDVSPLLAFDSTGSRLVTTSDTSGVYLWDLTSPASPTLLTEYLYKSGVGVRVRARFVGSELTWRGDDDIQVWSLGAATPTRRVKLDESEQLMAVDAVSGRVATRNAGRVRISALGDGPAVELIDPPSVTHAWFSADGSRLLTANRVGIDFQGLTVWSAHEGRMLSQVGGEDGVAFSEVLLNRDGSRCLTRPAKNGPTDLWDMNTGSRIASLGPDFVEKIEFSPDGRRFFIASSLSNEGQGGVWLHDAVTGEAIWEEVSTIYDPGGVSFSPDGVYIIVYDRSNSPGIAFSPVLLVDAKLGELVSDLSSPVGRILDAAFDRAGRWLFGMRDDGTVVRWRTLSRPGEAQQLARAMVERWK